MLEIYDKDRRKLAVLENAFGMEETTRINAISYFRFSLPDNDPKNEYCQRFHLIRYNNGEFYRIIKDGSEETETGRNDYECEHVIASLIDTIMPDFVSVGGLGYYTEQVLQYILGKQYRKDWILHECDFRRQYEYGWEKENLLSALFSVSNRFADKYIWKFDTSLYPYRISLKRLDENRNPDHYIRKGHNRLSLIRQSDSRNICTRIYPFGAGEGINQLTIANVNNGVRYLQSPPEYIEKYGLIETAWTDRRYTDEQSLLEAAQVMLNELQEPYVEYETAMTGNPKVGDIVQIVGGIKSFVVETTVAYEEVPQVSVKIANRPKDIAATVADLADRQRIEMTYSQGATQISADSGADNADSVTPYEISFYLSKSMIHINAVECKIRLSRFRAYNTNVISGGSTKTSSDGGGSTPTTSTTSTQSQTSNQGGSTSITSGTSQEQSSTSASGGGQRYGTEYSPGNVQHNHALTTLDHTHSFSIPGHSHTVTIGSHSHGFTIPGHSHTVNIGSHSHTVDTSHSHDITPKISFFGNPASFWLIINGKKKQFFESRDAEINITQYLVDAAERKIKRGKWHTIGVQPNDLARVEISYNITGFIQSRGDMTV